jgi:hypothetical protein
MNKLSMSRAIRVAVGERIERIHLETTKVIEVNDWEAKLDFDLEGKIQEVFTNPIAFPSLDQAIVAGDTVAIPMEPDVPQGLDVLEAVVRYLVRIGVSCEHITVLVSHDQENRVQSIRDRLCLIANQPIIVRFHHGDDPETMGYLAAASGAEGIYIDRAILEADVLGATQVSTVSFHGLQTRKHKHAGGTTAQPSVMQRKRRDCGRQKKSLGSWGFNPFSRLFPAQEEK